MPTQVSTKDTNLTEITEKSADGKVILAHYFVDKLRRIQGKWQFFYKNGRIASEANFKDGVREGKTILYYDLPNSPIWKVLRYQKGVIHGNCIEHTYNPHVCKIITFVNGQQVRMSHLQKHLYPHRIPVGPGLTDYGRTR